MNDSFIIKGPKYVGTNLFSATKDIFIQGKEVITKGCKNSESGKIKAKSCCDNVTKAKIIGIFMKFMALSLAVSAGFSVAITVPAVAITYSLTTAIKVAALFFAADIVEADKNTFQTVKLCETTGEILDTVSDNLENVGQNLKDMGDQVQNVAGEIKNQGKDWENRKTTKGFFSVDYWTTKGLNLLGKGTKIVGQGTEKLGQGIEGSGGLAQKSSELVEKGGNLAKNEGVIATIKINLLNGKDLKDTNEEATLRAIAKGTYIMSPLVNGLINLGRWLQHNRPAIEKCFSKCFSCCSK